MMTLLSKEFATFKEDSQQGPTVQRMNSAQCYGAVWMGGEFRGAWIHVYVWLKLYMYG